MNFVKILTSDDHENGCGFTLTIFFSLSTYEDLVLHIQVYWREHFFIDINSKYLINNNGWKLHVFIVIFLRVTPKTIIDFVENRLCVKIPVFP